MENKTDDNSNQSKFKTQESQQQESEENLSVCDIMKNDTSEVIKKLESNMPVMFQRYSDLYTGYLHMLDDVFGTCYIAEKEFFDKLNLDQKFLKQIKYNSESIRKYYIKNIELSSNLFDQSMQVKISEAKWFDDYAHLMMESYARWLSYLNKSIKISE